MEILIIHRSYIYLSFKLEERGAFYINNLRPRVGITQKFYPESQV